MTNTRAERSRVKLGPQAAAENVGPDGRRMSIDKQFHGDLGGTRGRVWPSARWWRSAGYVAMERVTGTLKGGTGTFALHHNGVMNRGAPTLRISVVNDPHW